MSHIPTQKKQTGGFGSNRPLPSPHPWRDKRRDLDSTSRLPGTGTGNPQRVSRLSATPTRRLAVAVDLPVVCFAKTPRARDRIRASNTRVRSWRLARIRANVNVMSTPMRERAQIEARP